MPDMGSRESRTGLAIIALTSVAWGTIPLVIRRVGDIPVDLPVIGAWDAAPVVMVFWRVCIAAVAMLAYLAATRRLPELLEVDRKSLAGLAVNGVLLALHWFLFFSALSLTEVAVAELLTYTGPIYVAALTPLVLRERFDRRVLVAMGLALTGTAVILGPDVGAFGDDRALLGAGMAVVAAFGYAFLMLNVKRLLRDFSTPVVMFWETFTATLVLLPAALLLPGFDDPGEWAAVATLGLFHSGLVAFAFLAGLRRVRADHAAVLMYIEPVSAVLFAALFLGEPLAPTTLFGGVGVIAGGALVARLAGGGGVEAPAPTRLSEG